MRNFYALIMVALLLCGFAGTKVSAQEGRGGMSEGKTPEELAQLAVDYAELQNLMSLHAYYHAAAYEDVELKEIWSKRDDIVWAQNAGYWIGQEDVQGYYGTSKAREDTYGMFIFHSITTGVIEVAEDRQTAKGLWQTPGIVGGFDSQFQWMWERYGVDFVLEDGVWKVWHMHVYTDAAWEIGGTLSPTGMENPPGATPTLEEPQAGAEKFGLEGAAGSDAPAENSGPTVSKQNYDEVSPTTTLKMVPRPPEPYKTWSETFSYVGEGE